MLFLSLCFSSGHQLVESVISNLGAEHSTEFHVVRLNGFIQTDDKLALREIWRQLGREMELEADHLTKVRLSPPSLSLYRLPDSLYFH